MAAFPADELPMLVVHCKTLKDRLSQQNVRELMKAEDFQKLMSNLVDSQKDSYSGLLLQLITETFGCLRNSCVMCRRNQDLIARHDGLLKAVTSTFKKLLLEVEQKTCSSSRQPPIQACHCGVQFLGNLVTNHLENAKLVWEETKSYLRQLVSINDVKLTNYTCMLIKNGMMSSATTRQQVLEELPEIVVDILDVMRRHDIEWGLFVIQDLLQHDGFLRLIWKLLDHAKRLILLDVLLESLAEAEQQGHMTVSVDNVAVLVDEFNTSGRVILHTSEGYSGLEPVVFVKILDVLCSATALHHLYSELQNNEELVKVTINLLQAMHMIGKTGDNMFTSLSKISSQEPLDQSHPSYALKRQLVRLIGNAVFRHRANQDMVRQLNGIPLLLDHTVIDKRNPYIAQWSIFAVHNLCENNQENQLALSQLKLDGVADDVNLLKECGISAEVKNGKVVVKPAPLLPDS